MPIFRASPISARWILVPWRPAPSCAAPFQAAPASMVSAHGPICGLSIRSIAELSEAHCDLVTLTAVTQPDSGRLAQRSTASIFKDHYLYDPSLGFPVLSKRTREHQRRAEQVYTFDIPADPHERLAIVAVYQELKRRRGLAGGFFDFPRAHFERVALWRAPSSFSFA